MRRLCAEAGCMSEAVSRCRCREHARERDRLYRSANAPIYASKRWKITRRRQLFLEPLCQHPGCNRVATDVHHLTDLQDGGALWSFENLESLCHAHHSEITRSRQGKGRLTRASLRSENRRMPARARRSKPETANCG
jgi:5-methylcytosine-specific restriction enzyme A